MLISRSRKFIFVHIYKNAGTSIRDALSPFALNKLETVANRLSMRFRRRVMVNPKPFADHVTAPQLVEELGKSTFDSYFSFAIVRNPWDWQVSLYNYMLKNTGHHQHEFIAGLRGFSDYVFWRCDNEVRLQRDFIYIGNELLVDYVGRFESLDSDFQAICNRIGIVTTLPKLNVSNTTPYRKYYTDETRELVAQAFAPDIRQFGYEF